MERELQTVQLSNCEVSVVTYLTWAEKQNIDTFLASGAGLKELENFENFKLGDNSIVNWKKNTMKICIKGIKTGAVTKYFDDEFFNNLSVEDGEVLWSVIEQFTQAKKN